MNQWFFRHSARNPPLKASMKARAILHEPMAHDGTLGRLARSQEVVGDPAPTGPEVHVARDELAALVDQDRGRIKGAREVDLQMMHCIRSRLATNRTNPICQMRPYCLGHGVTLRTGAGVFKLDIARVVGETSNDLTDRVKSVLRQLQEELLAVEERIGSISTEIKNIADADETARRLPDGLW